MNFENSTYLWDILILEDEFFASTSTVEDTFEIDLTKLQCA